jgi:hypothetical protein
VGPKTLPGEGGRRIFFIIYGISHKAESNIGCNGISLSGVYKLDSPPPLPGGEGISADIIWGKNMKRGKEKGRKCKRKRKKGE